MSRRSQDSSGSGFAVLLLLGAIAWVIAFIIRHIWVILGIAVVVGSIYLAKAIVQDNRRRREAYDRYCAGLAAKADQQDDWVAAGDERGIYGPGAVELMRYIRSGAKGAPPAPGPTPTVVAPQPLSTARKAAAPAIVASGVGIALMLGQVDGPGSGSSPAPSTPTRTTTPYPSWTPSPRTTAPSFMPSLTPTPSPTPTYEPTYESPPPSYLPPPTTEAPPLSTYVPPPTTVAPAPVYEAPQSTYFRNCSAAHAAGRYNIPVGDPGYRPGLDRDGDGYACE